MNPTAGLVPVKVVAANKGINTEAGAALETLYSHPCHCRLPTEGIILRLDTFEIKHKDLNTATLDVVPYAIM